MLQEFVSTMNKYYDTTNVDSVSVTLVFISIITILCMVYNLCVLLRKKCSVDEGTNAGLTSWIKFCFIIVTGRLCVMQLGLMRDVIWSNYICRTEKI